MIQGLKVTLLSAALANLCVERASHHEERSYAYQRQIDAMEAEGMGKGTDDATNLNYSGNQNPVDALKQRKASHDNNAKELRFIATHLDVDETYVLDRADLQRLGIVNDRMF